MNLSTIVMAAKNAGHARFNKPMKPVISKSVSTFKCTKSPVREIMDLANPLFFKKAGLDPAEVISFSGGWVNHEAPAQLREAYAEIIRDEKPVFTSAAATRPPSACRNVKAPLWILKSTCSAPA